MEKRVSLGGNSIGAEVHPIVTAYVVIPADQDREKYIRNCYGTRTVMLRDEYGASWNKVFVPKGQMEKIVFPKTSEDLGSFVIANRVQKHNYPVLVAVFDLKNVASIVSKEYQFRQQAISNSDNSIDLDAKADDCSLNISVNSKENGKGNLDISVSNPDNTAELNIFVKGNVNVRAEETIKLIAHKDTEMLIHDENDELKASFKYIQGSGYFVKDEFGNILQMKKEQILLKEASGGVEFEIKKNQINLGKSGNSSEQVVLGNQLKAILKEILAAINSITVTVSTTPSVSSIPNNSAKFSEISNKLDTILSKIVKTE